jgi:hypothetical protein
MIGPSTLSPATTLHRSAELKTEINVHDAGYDKSETVARGENVNLTV